MTEDIEAKLRDIEEALIDHRYGSYSHENDVRWAVDAIRELQSDLDQALHELRGEKADSFAYVRRTDLRIHELNLYRALWKRAAKRRRKLAHIDHWRLSHNLRGARLRNVTLHERVAELEAQVRALGGEP